MTKIIRAYFVIMAAIILILLPGPSKQQLLYRNIFYKKYSQMYWYWRYILNVSHLNIRFMSKKSSSFENTLK